MRLSFDGPFAATPDAECGYPSLASSPVAEGCGIYLWAVKRAESYRIAYLGKTQGKTRNFKIRIAEEVCRFMRGDDGYFELSLFRNGVRQRVPAPQTGARELSLELMRCSPVFVATVECEPRFLRVIESALIRKIQAHSVDTRAFLAHGSPPMQELLPTPVTVSPPPGISFEGLEGEIR